LLLSNEQLETLCSYLSPDSVCQLEQTCSQLQERMDQETIWKNQVDSFPVSGVPFGDSTEATFRKLRRRFDYFNQKLFNSLTVEPEWLGWHNPFRVALRIKITLDKLLLDVKHFTENDFHKALDKLKEEANMNSDTDWNYKHILKKWQVKVDLDEPDKWDSECRDYLQNWMVHGQILPPNKNIDWQVYNNGNVFIIESGVYHDNLIIDDSESDEEDDSEALEELQFEDDIDGDSEDDEEGEDFEDDDDFDDDSNDDKVEENAEDLN